MIDAALEELERAQAIAAPLPRLLALRNAGEGLAEALRAATASVSIHLLRLERIVLEREVALPALRLPFPLLTLEHRAWLARTSEGIVLVDPVVDGSFVKTPFGQRIRERHPLRTALVGSGGRLEAALAAESVLPREVRRIAVTSLRYRSLSALLEMFENAEIWMHPAEHARALALSPSERAAYEREPVSSHPRLRLVGQGVLAPGLVWLGTPGLGAGSMSAVARHEGQIRVLSPHGCALDAWTPYESRLPGLREALRLRDIEALPRGDADPIESAVSMGLERTLADRQKDAPAFHCITPSLELVPSVLCPLAPTLAAR